MATLASARAQRFHAYVERLTTALGHQDRHGPFRDYVTGLCLPGERKSIEPMAARVDPRHVRARHQSMHHFIANAAWDDAAVLRVARETVLAALERHGPVAAWVVDDTGIPKKGRHSVGVARQYCGVLGKQDNCQVAVSVSVAHERASVPVAYRLYLPEAWAQDRRRRRAVGVPNTVAFRAKWRIALEQLAQLTAEGVPAAPVVADAGYGVVTAFREALTTQGIPYIVGISTETTVWAPGRAPLPPRKYGGRGRPPTLVRRTPRHRPLSVQAVAQQLPAGAWRTVTWRQGTRGAMRSRFAAVRVRPAHRDEGRSTPRPEEWLLIEWPRIEAAPIKYWLSTLPSTATCTELVPLAMLRWRIERDYQELKDELGLDHFEGRGWRGFHHHASLCIAAYAFLAAERLAHFPPEPLAFLRPARLPKGFTPRGAPRAS
jgi:SRSO17 transposase